MTASDVDVVRRLFRAVEERDLEAMLACYADDVEIHEAESLPYGGVYRGREGAVAHAMAFLESWGRYQGAEEARLEARVIGDGSGTVAVSFWHKATGPRDDMVLREREVSIYEVRDGKVARSQMFHADVAKLNGFLEKGASP